MEEMIKDASDAQLSIVLHEILDRRYKLEELVLGCESSVNRL